MPQKKGSSKKRSSVKPKVKITSVKKSVKAAKIDTIRTKSVPKPRKKK